MKNDEFGNRMKGYENQYRIYLPKKQAVIIRIDGKAAHTFTRNFKKPFDELFLISMRQTALNLCKNIENAKLAYTQSDEISLLLTDFDNEKTEPWFGNNLQKLASVSASIATFYFNKIFRSKIYTQSAIEFNSCYFYYSKSDINEKDRLFNAYKNALSDGLMFDARAFVLPKEEVCNYFYWRQTDCIRNSIQMVARAHFSHKQLQSLSCEEILNKLKEEKEIDYEENFLISERQGVCVVKDEEEQVIDFQTGLKKTKKSWIIDYVIPNFSKNREYIERFL